MSKKFAWINDIKHNVAIDEHWPLYHEDQDPEVVGLCWTWTGVNTLGLFFYGRCWLGVQWVFNDEPSFALVLNNYCFGFWFKDPEKD